ncbi:hypothetical protein GWO43_31460 [candidate division KSB1 bacterium]|nr:hypothetical protein [candidate division KSB1 bacterium]NIR73428.1 hypothetical protein [candidate division KSB1 bacterium]NIS28419.1 hypothetical protein [candidate division KSB1 bacterium]NIT75299.1 hypothetical protein [candidate division KSB1 bacterium]NIU29147.1 hypothetical protein [candidate division KSB1 bacterium]
MKKIALLLTMGILAFNSWSCNETPTAPQIPGENEIWFRNGAVTPKNLNVSIGTTVTWTNMDVETHSVDSGTFMNPTQDFPSSKNLTEGERFSHRFTEAGSFPFYCSIHQTQQSETGTINVN